MLLSICDNVFLFHGLPDKWEKLWTRRKMSKSPEEKHQKYFFPSVMVIHFLSRQRIPRGNIFVPFRVPCLYLNISRIIFHLQHFLLFNRMTVHLTCACKRLIKIDKQHGEECGKYTELFESKKATHFYSELQKWADRYTVSHGGSFFSFSCYHVSHCFPFITCVKSSRTIENLWRAPNHNNANCA